MQERFPPGVYTLLVGLFWGAATLVARGLTAEGRVAPAAAVVTWLFFLHLRILDEHKDYEDDLRAFPDRLLSRGVVTLGLLRRVEAGALGASVLLAATLGLPALLAWGATLAFSVAMRFEFGVGRWLREHLVVYALTHNPVVAGLAVFLYLATGARWEWADLWFVAVASLGSLAFELGRKIRLPEEEYAGVPSYTTELGQAGARALLGGTYVLLWAAVSGLLYALRLGDPWPPLIGLLCVAPGLLSTVGAQPAKRVEGAASVVLLLGFVACGAGAWVTA